MVANIFIYVSISDVMDAEGAVELCTLNHIIAGSYNSSTGDFDSSSVGA